MRVVKVKAQRERVDPFMVFLGLFLAAAIGIAVWQGGGQAWNSLSTFAVNVWHEVFKMPNPNYISLSGGTGTHAAAMGQYSKISEERYDHISADYKVAWDGGGWSVTAKAGGSPYWASATASLTGTYEPAAGGTGSVTVAEWTPPTHTITITAGAHGSTDEATQDVTEGDDLTVTAIAADWHEIDTLLIDDEEEPDASGEIEYPYTFENVSEDHDYEVSFTPQQFSLTLFNRTIAVDASTLTPPDGITITGYEWDWGDESTAGTGEANSHTYSAGGTYTVTLTLTLSDASEQEFTRSISMATITKVNKLVGIAGTTEITITGTGFGSTQSTGTAKVGDKALTSITWSDTSIVGTLASDTPATGGQDIVVTPAGGTAVTLANGIYVYVSTEQFDSTLISTQRMKKVYFNGAHVGYTEDTFELGRTIETIDYKSNSQKTIVKTETIGIMDSLKLTLSQINGANLALVWGGSYDATTKVATFGGNDNYAEIEVMAEDVAGRFYLLPRCQVITAPNLVLSSNEFAKLPLEFRVLCQPDDLAMSMQIQFP